jgi:hypoxanthine phosphoribosyltransferase
MGWTDKHPEKIFPDIEGVIVTRKQIAARVRELGEEIARVYDGGEVTILGVLTGSLIFLADLIRELPMRLRVSVVGIRSYPDAAMVSQGATLTMAPELDFAGRDVLVIDDILDTGQTLQLLLDIVTRNKPASLRTCILLSKDRPELPDRPKADFIGFQVPRRFVVGYGLDHDNLYRNLPDICILKADSPPEMK